MFFVCHFKEDGSTDFILYDKENIQELADHMNLEIVKEISFEQLNNEFSLYAIVSMNDLLLRSLNQKARTTSHVLDEIGISCWEALKIEHYAIQQKQSKLSRSQRDLVEKQYRLFCE